MLGMATHAVRSSARSPEHPRGRAAPHRPPESRRWEKGLGGGRSTPPGTAAPSARRSTLSTGYRDLAGGKGGVRGSPSSREDWREPGSCLVRDGLSESTSEGVSEPPLPQRGICSRGSSRFSGIQPAPAQHPALSCSRSTLP